MNEESIQSKDNQHSPIYCSYLLRLWCAGQVERGSWRASLENSHTREWIGFASLEELFAFLIEQVEDDGTRRLFDVLPGYGTNSVMPGGKKPVD
jgi:hypothetical protein